jgi:hypothetical protein
MAKPDWQNQNYSKSAGAAGPSTMNAKIAGSRTVSMHSKIAMPTVRNYADGGSVDDTSNPDVKFDMGEFAGVDKAVAQNSDSDWARGEVYGDNTTPEQRAEMTGGPKIATNQEVMDAAKEADAKPAARSFSDAFRNAKDGSTFEWNGKQYKKEYAKSESKPQASRKVGAVDSAPDTGDETARLAKRVQIKNTSGRGVIDTSNIDPKTLLPRRS